MVRFWRLLSIVDNDSLKKCILGVLYDWISVWLLVMCHSWISYPKIILFLWRILFSMLIKSPGLNGIKRAFGIKANVWAMAQWPVLQQVPGPSDHNGGEGIALPRMWPARFECVCCVWGIVRRTETGDDPGMYIDCNFVSSAVRHTHASVCASDRTNVMTWWTWIWTTNQCATKQYRSNMYHHNHFRKNRNLPQDVCSCYWIYILNKPFTQWTWCSLFRPLDPTGPASQTCADILPIHEIHESAWSSNPRNTGHSKSLAVFKPYHPVIGWMYSV